MKNKNIKLLTKFSLLVLMMSPVSTVISAKTSSDYGNAVVMAPTANDTAKKDSNETVESTNDNGDSDTVIKDAPKIDATTKTDNTTKTEKKQTSTKKKTNVKVDAPTADSISEDDATKIDDQRGLAKWKNYKGPLAKYMTHIYKGKPLKGVNAKKTSTEYSIFSIFLKYNFVNKKGQMDTGIAQKFNYNVETGKSIKPAAIDTNMPIPVTESDKSGGNANLETSYKPATGSDDPWKEGTLHFKYTNKINASTGWDGANNAGLITQMKRGLGFGAIIDLPKNVTYSQIINGFENGQLVIAEPGTNWHGMVTESTLETVGQSPDPDNPNSNRWQLTDSSKYFSPVKGDDHKMYFSMHKFLIDADKDLSNNEPDQNKQPFTTAFFDYILMAIMNHISATQDPGNNGQFNNIPITFETDINIPKAIPDGIIAASDGYKTDATDESEVTKQSINRLPPAPDALLHMGVKFYSYDQINATSNYADEWGIKSGTADPYDARSDLQTWSNFIRPIDPSTGTALKYDSNKGAYIYDKQVVTSGKQKALDFTKVWDIYANKAATNPQDLTTDKSISELKAGGGTITYSSKTKDLKPVKIYFSNVSEEAINHKPIVKDVKLDPITMVKESEKDIAVSGIYSDEDTSDKISLEYQIDDGPLKDVEGYQNVSKKQAKAMAAKYEKKLKKQQAKAAKEIAAHKKALAAKPSVVKKNKILTNNIIGGIQQPSIGENDSLVIADDGGQLTYSISTEKSGNPSQTAVGDEVTVHTRVSADAPQNTKINGQDAYVRLLNSAFIFPYEYENGANGKPMLEEMNNGDGVGGLYSSDGNQKVSIKTWKYGDGSFDDDKKKMALRTYWDFGEMVGAIPGYSIKGTTTYEGNGFEEVYSDSQYGYYDGGNFDPSNRVLKNYPQPGQAGADGTNTEGGVPTTAAYVAFKNKMAKGDYLEFTYKYKVGEGADGVSPSKLRFYAGISDYAASVMFGNYIGTDLPGETINSIAVNPDQTEYDAEVTQANLSSYSQAMTGTYTDTSGTTPTIQYEVNSSNEKPSSNAKAATVDGTKKTYSANVTSGNWKFGVNTVRFFLTAKDGKVTYADVTVNLTEKIDPDKDFNFTIPASEIKEFDDKEVGKHTVHVYAVDDKGAKSDDVKDVSTGDFEVTSIPNTAPVIDTLVNEKGEQAGPAVQGSNLNLKLGWHDAESKDFTASYHITSPTDTQTDIASGDINPTLLENPEPGKGNETTFAIPSVIIDKLEVGQFYNINVELSDDGGLSDKTRSKTYQIRVEAANKAPVVKKIVGDNGMPSIQSFEVGSPLSLHMTWNDTDSSKFTAQYKITGMGNNTGVVATGDIDSETIVNDKPGTDNVTDFVIPSSDTAKMAVGASNSYKITVILKDDGGAVDDKEQVMYQILGTTDPKPSLQLPDKLSFKEVTVGSTRQLDLRDVGWDKIKNSDSDKLSVTVQQTTPWAADGLSTSLSPIEMVSSDDEFSSNRGTPIDKAAVPVKFKADGTLDWSDKFGLFQPIGSGDLAGSYSTELTWTTTDAPK